MWDMTHSYVGHECVTPALELKHPLSQTHIVRVCKPVLASVRDPCVCERVGVWVDECACV